MSQLIMVIMLTVASYIQKHSHTVNAVRKLTIKNWPPVFYSVLPYKRKSPCPKTGMWSKIFPISHPVHAGKDSSFPVQDKRFKKNIDGWMEKHMPALSALLCFQLLNTSLIGRRNTELVSWVAALPYLFFLH